ncbi:MAG: HAMP domain-containing sensor histidine kinase [Chloroflexi bacterium]|nr:HAMP domain-containing sensor histidine kinase [Chloroflexota bacterium]
MQVPRAVLSYVAIVLILGISITIYAFARYPLDGDLTTWLLFVAFAGLTLLTDRYGLHFAHGTHVHIDTIPLFAGVLVFSPPQIILIVVVARLLGRIGQGRRMLERVFNLGQTLTYVAISSLALHAFVSAPWRPTSLSAWTALLVAGTAMYLLNTGLVAGIVSLNAHVPLFRIWAASLGPALLEHLVMFSFGTLTVLVVVPYPWALVFVTGPSAAVFVMLDRTLRMEAQHKQLADQNAGLATYLGQQAEQLRESYQVLARALDTKDKLLSSIFRTLRSPLETIAGRGATVRHKLAAGEANGALADLDVLLRNAEMANHFVKEFVALQVLERRQLLLEEFTIEALFEDVLETPEAQVLCAEVDVYADFAADLPALHADRGRLKQMIVQLLDNAVRFSVPGGQVLLTAARADGDMVQITVTDHGQGIPKAQLPQVFDWFTAVDGSGVNASGSQGLGLAIAKRVAELHGGGISIESQPGQTTTVTVTLPTQPPGIGSG